MGKTVFRKMQATGRSKIATEIYIKRGIDYKIVHELCSFIFQL